MAARPVEVGVNDFSSPLVEKFRTEQHRFQAVHVNAVKGGIQHMKGSAPVFRQRFIFFGSQGIDLLDHGLVMRRHKLGPIIEVSLETVVMGGVVAGGQHHAGIRMEFPDSKGDFRSGARTVEQVNVTTQVRADFCAEFGKVTGKVARVVSDDQAGLPARVRSLHMLVHINNQATHGPPHIEVVHAGGSHAGIFRAAVHAAVPLLGPGYDAADGASPQPPRSEGQRFVKTVVQLLPFPGGNQFLYGLACYGGFGSIQQKADIGPGRLQKLPFFNGIHQGFVQCIHAGGIVHHAPCLTIALSIMA